MIKFENQEVQVSGKIAYENAETYFQEGLAQIKGASQSPLVFNLEHLEQGSTLALAVMVRWLRVAPDIKSIHFKSVPLKMMKIIQACHLEQDLKLI